MQTYLNQHYQNYLAGLPLKEQATADFNRWLKWHYQRSIELMNRLDLR